MDSIWAIEVSDGSTIVFVGEAPSPRAREEFEVWGLVPILGPEPEVSRAEPAAWQQALEAGPLAVAVFQGVLGNAAWDVFPAAGRYLRALRSGKEAVADAGAAAAATRRAIGAMGLSRSGSVSIVQASRDGEGVWHIRFRVGDGREGDARITAGGAVTHVELDRVQSS